MGTPSPRLFIVAAIVLVGFSSIRAVIVLMDRREAVWCVTPIGADLGRIPMRLPAKQRFEIINRGHSELLLLETKVDCECMMAELPVRVLLPGRSMQIEVTFTPKKPGKRKQQMLIRTNDSANPVTAVTIIADVYGPATQPATRSLGAYFIGTKP